MDFKISLWHLVLKKIKLLGTFLLLFTTLAGSAQKLEANLDFRVRFDNREYKSEFSKAKTLFGFKLAPEAGLRWGGDNRLMGGMDLTRHFGAWGDDQPKPELILYYAYENRRNFTAYAGIFQNDKLAKYPRMFISGSRKFYDPLIEGAMFRWFGTCGQVELSCDWNGMIAETKREKFVIQSAGFLRHGVFSAGYYLMIHHFSITKTPAADEGVIDNILAYPYIGAEMVFGAEKNTLLGIKAGWVQALQNDRAHEDKFVKPGGFMAEIDFKWRSFGCDNALYLGDDLMPYYDRYGSELYPGDPFFRTDHGIYNRLELFWQPNLKEGLALKISTVHHYDGRTWNWQQLAIFSVKLNRKTFK